MTSHEQLLTITEAAALLRVSPSALYKLARRGEVPMLRVGRLLRFDRQALLAHLASGPSETAR